MQKILEAENHTKRVELMLYFVDYERRRLQARKSLKSIFSGISSSGNNKEAEERRRTQSMEEVESRSKTQFYDEEDAWQ
jgi:hypothetical protein